MVLRNDIYSPEAQKYLDTLVNRTQQAFPTIFPTTNDVINYVNNFKTAKLAELFLDIGDYYNSAKYYTCPECIPPKKVETCPSCQNTIEMPDFILLIMAFSVMEKLAFVESSGIENWVDFYDWVSRKDITAEYWQTLKKGKFRDFNALVDSLKARWNREYGSLTKVTNFLLAIMSPNEKQTLIKSIRYIQKVPNLPTTNKTTITQPEHNQQITFTSQEELKEYIKQNSTQTTLHALPICYEKNRPWNCYTINNSQQNQGYCQNKNDCTLISDVHKLDKCLKDTIKTLHDWQTKFIHDAQLPPTKELSIYGETISKDKYLATLSTTQFKTVFEQLVKKFFDKYQTEQNHKTKRKH
jgi:hypothetical protein